MRRQYTRFRLNRVFRLACMRKLIPLLWVTNHEDLPGNRFLADQAAKPGGVLTVYQPHHGEQMARVGQGEFRAIGGQFTALSVA